MSGGVDALGAVYLVCFIVGFAMTLISFISGASHFGDTNLHGGHVGGSHIGTDGGAHVGDAHAGGGIDVAHAPDAGGHAGGGHGPAAVSPFNFSTVMAFLTWFGGAGYILRAYSHMWASLGLLIAILAGLFGGGLVFMYLARILIPGQTAMDPTDYYLPGTVARVSIPIREGRIGEIIYSQGGYRKSAGARSVTGREIARNTEVVIVRYEKGLAYVQPWESYIEEGPADKAEGQTKGR